MYRNIEGYADPTAGEAFRNIARDEISELRRREERIINCRRIYVVSKYAGDVTNNTSAAVRYCRFVVGKGFMPVASHLLYPVILDDNDRRERFIGTMFGIALLRFCNEVWVFGEPLSKGMRREELEAKRAGKKLRYFTESCEERPA